MLIAQITDTHLVDKEKYWLGEPSCKIHERFFRVISYINNLDPLPDLVLLTGDATETGSRDTYLHLKELASTLIPPLYLIPGNHDDREEMRMAFYDKPYMPLSGFIQYAIDGFPLQLIGLDTNIPGERFGLICEERLAWLEKTLEAEPAKPTLLFMHHPPAKTGTVLFDAIICRTTPHFEALVREYKNVIGILAGHYHHLCITSFAGKPCFIAPSVAPVHYFARQEDEKVTALELEDPSVSLHHWHGGTVLTSHVRRIKDDYRRIDWDLITQKQEMEECQTCTR